MGNTIKVDPAALTTAAGKIEGSASEYKQLYDKIYSDVSSMRAGWTGVDNQAFADQIDGFKPEFGEMFAMMNEYARFLRDAAAKYEATQTEVTNGARRLTN